MGPKLLLGLLVILVIVTFAANNDDLVTVSYYFGQTVETTLWMAALAAFILGVTFTSLGWVYSSVKSRGSRKKLQKEIVRLEDEVKNLKNKPLPYEPTVYPTEVEPKEGASQLPTQAPKRLEGKLT